MRSVGFATVLTTVIASSSVDAVDLNGRWRFGSGVIPSGIVQITQTGNALSIPLGPATFVGTVGSTDANGFTSYSVSWSDGGGGQAGFGGRVMPSGNLLDGRGGGFFPPGPPFVGGVVATRCSCFDTNSDDGDGCDSQCQVEPCWTCVGDPSVCTPTLDGGACDDLSPCTTGETCTAGVCGGGTPLAPCFDIGGPWTRHYSAPALDIETHTFTTIDQRGTDLSFDGYIGAINPLTGAIDVRIANPHVFCGAFDTLVGSVAGDGLTYTLTGFLALPQPFAPDHCDFFAQSEIGDHCGDGNLDGTEECDDGDLEGDDGCSPVCEVEQCFTCSGTPSNCTPAGGAPCDDEEICTLNDTCAGDGTCTGTPNVGASCDDDSLCTSDDACTAGGTCAGAPVECGVCHICEPSLGCLVQGSVPCDDGDACTLNDLCTFFGTCAGTPEPCEPCFACDGTGGCVLEPQTSCKLSTEPAKSLLLVKDNSDDTKDRISWRWNRGSATQLDELGSPPSGDDMSLCIYDESSTTPSLLFRATIPGGTSWRSSAMGFSYRDSSASADGTQFAQIRSADAGKAKATVKGKGIHLSDRTYGLPAPTLPLPLRVQLQGENGLCLESRYESGSVIKNDASRGIFKARGTP